jgi:hypothetical protein
MHCLYHTLIVNTASHHLPSHNDNTPLHITAPIDHPIQTSSSSPTTSAVELENDITAIRDVIVQCHGDDVIHAIENVLRYITEKCAHWMKYMWPVEMCASVVKCYQVSYLSN